uniref:DMT family transporter n=1 Tax=Castellaniella defragrans TaxID=75697 RepID=UPI0033408B4C
MLSRHALDRHAFALALPFILLWASAFPATKFALRDCPPLVFLFMRFLFAGVLLVGLAYAQGERFRLGRRDWAALILLAACNHALYLGISWTGMRELSSGLSTIIISASPILVSLLAIPLLGERMTPRKLMGLLLGFAGVVFIVHGRIDNGTDTLRGALLVACALLILSLGTVIFKRVSVQMNLTGNLGLQVLLASAIMLPWSLAAESWRDVHFTANTVGALLWCVIMVSIGGYLLWFALLRATHASAASAWFFLTPPLGLLMGWLILGEQLEWHDFAGVLPVVIGIMLVTRAAEPSTRGHA